MFILVLMPLSCARHPQTPPPTFLTPSTKNSQRRQALWRDLIIYMLWYGERQDWTFAPVWLLVLTEYYLLTVLINIDYSSIVLIFKSVKLTCLFVGNRGLGADGCRGRHHEQRIVWTGCATRWDLAGGGWSFARNRRGHVLCRGIKVRPQSNTTNSSPINTNRVVQQPNHRTYLHRLVSNMKFETVLFDTAPTGYARLTSAHFQPLDSSAIPLHFSTPLQFLDTTSPLPLTAPPLTPHPSQAHP